MLKTVVDRLAHSPYLLGERFCAADLLWGFAFHWGMMFDLVPKDPIIVNYATRIIERPSCGKVSAQDATLAAEHQAACASASS